MFIQMIGFRELEPITIFQVYLVQGAIFSFFLLMALKVLKRGKTRIYRIFSGFYLSICIGFFINFIFVLFLIEPLVWFLYLVTMYFLNFGIVFLTVFTMMLRSGELSKKRQNIVIITFALLLIGMFFIPGGLVINQKSDWHPIYSDSLIIFFLTVISISFIPALYNSIQIYKTIDDNRLKKRWRYFLLGIIFVGMYGYGTLITYKITLGVIIIPYGIATFILMLLSSYFLYYGMAKNF
ncbi:MAG: hypothetical protein EU533_07540 [Promethearchaeota archaeon]|nr:MAG: hypothetical protein EU533_07540 [Candidatus Lokiarchaeota archaeon]